MAQRVVTCKIVYKVENLVALTNSYRVIHDSNNTLEPIVYIFSVLKWGKKKKIVGTDPKVSYAVMRTAGQKRLHLLHLSHLFFFSRILRMSISGILNIFNMSVVFTL